MLGKVKLNTIEVLISKALVNSYISHDQFVPVNNVLREDKEMKEEIKTPQNGMEYIIKKRWKRIMSVVRKILRTKIQVSEKLNKIDQCFYQIVLFMGRKNQGSLKIENSIKYYSTVLIIFETIILK